MAESTDKKTRKIAEKRVERGKEFEGYQEAQNQLLAIQAEQQQNLALQANDAMNIQQQNQTLAQAAEVMAMDNLNPATQEVLAGYGLNQPRVIKQSNTQRQGPNNITINNTTINNASGPVQGREVSIRPQEAGQSKFKAWLTNVFARQDAQWQKQNQEYARRESSLTRNSNKMMRKIEGLGKEIGSAVDPRKIANSVSNPLMNLIKSIGLLALAKRLPKILKFIDNAETTIKGWFSGIGDTIKSAIGDIDLSELGDKIWNDRETGYLNKALQKISEFITGRAEYASRQTDIIPFYEVGKKILTWLQLFFGGQAVGVKIQKENIRSDLYDDDKVVSEDTENYSYTNPEMRAERDGDSIIRNSENMYGVSSADLKNWISKDEYEKWLKNNNKKASDSTAKEFLAKKNYIYTGESVILMKEVYKNPAHVLNKEYDFFAGRLRTDSIYGSIAASHDLISEVRRGYRSQGVDKVLMIRGGTYHYYETRIASMKAIMFYLDLLYQRALVGGSVIFEDAFNLITDTSLRKSLLESGDAKKITVILIKQPMDEPNKRRYWKEGTTGLSNYYKKLVRTDHGDIDTNNALPLKEEDFKGKKYQKKWTFYSVSRVGFGEIIEKMTGSGVDNIFSEQSQINACDYINRNAIGLDFLGSKFKGENETFHFTRNTWEDYEKAIEEKNYYDLEKTEYEDLDKLGEIKYNSSSTYNISDTKASATPKGTIDDIQSINISAEQKKKNMDEVYNFFKSKGFSDEQIAGIMGVLGVESAGTFDPRIVNVDEVKKLGINSAGEGIAQWSVGKGWNRKIPFMEWWKKQHPGKDWMGIRNTSLQDQLNYLMHEWQTSHKYSYDEINKLKNDKSLTPAEIIEKTTDYFTRGFENGNNKALANYSLWGGGKGSRYKYPYSEAFKTRLNNASGIYNSFIKKGNPTITTQGRNATTANTQKASRNQPNSTVADNVIDNTTTVTPVITPTIETPTNTQTVSQSLAMAETIEHNPQTQVSQNQPNTAELEYLSLIAQSTDYTARALTPLVDNMNAGFTMVAQSGKSTPAKTRADTLNTENEGNV
jgi:hypothetical protein